MSDLMVLADSFYYQPVQIDTINTRVNTDLFAKEGDVNGRGILLTLTENGLVKDTTGIALNLKWEHLSVGNQGIDNFEAVDLSKGLYKITYPIEMLNLGTVSGYIQIIDSGKSAGIRNLTITIERGVGDDTLIVRSDSFTALTQALVDVNNLDKTYATELLSVKQQLVTTDSRISNIIASAGDGTIPYELSDIRVGKDGELYISAGDFTRAASEGRFPKTSIDSISGWKADNTTHTWTHVAKEYNGRTLGATWNLNLVEPTYTYSRARIAGKVFDDLKTKKFRVTVRCNKDIILNVMSTNGVAWGSNGGEIGLVEDVPLTLNAANKHEASAVFDLSSALYSTFYSDSRRLGVHFQQVDFLIVVNNGFKNPAGAYAITYEVSEVVSDKFEDLTVGRQVVSAVYADTAGSALTANSATTAVSATNATTSDFAVNAGVGNFFATGKIDWEGIGASILDLEKNNTLRIKYAAGAATGSIYYVRIQLCAKVSDLIGRTIIMNGKNLNAGVAGDIGDGGFYVGFSYINAGQWGNVKLAHGFASTLDGEELSGDTVRTTLIAAGATDQSPVYVQLSNSSAVYTQTPYSCDKTVQVLLTAKSTETTVIATKLLGFTPSDYVAKGEGAVAIPLTVNTYAGSGVGFDNFTKTVSGLITRVTRPEIANPDKLWSYGLISVNLGPLSGLANKQVYVHFDDSASAHKFSHTPMLTKAYSNWTNRVLLPNNDSPEFYKVYEPSDIYDVVVASGSWAPTDNVVLCFTYDNGVGTGTGVVPKTDITMSVLTRSKSDYSVKTSLQVADLLDGFDPGDYALASDLVAAVEDVLAAGDYITCWGDSLTAGGGWTTQLQTFSGKTVYNGGTGGENVKTIAARQGADVMMVNNITIPATTDAVLIASRNVEGGIKTAFGHTVTPLLQGGAHVNPVMIDGIEGTLSWTGADYADVNGTWTFRRTTAGTEKIIDRPSAIRTEFDRNKNGGIQIIFIGQNGGYIDDADLINTHKLMMAHSTAKHTIILGLSSGSAASRAAYETAMRKEFGRYFISLREYLSTYGIEDAGLTPTQADLDAMATGTVPPQLLSDTVHYTSATKTVIGNMLYKKMVELNIF